MIETFIFQWLHFDYTHHSLTGTDQYFPINVGLHSLHSVKQIIYFCMILKATWWCSPVLQTLKEISGIISTQLLPGIAGSKTGVSEAFQSRTTCTNKPTIVTNKQKHWQIIFFYHVSSKKHIEIVCKLNIM